MAEQLAFFDEAAPALPQGFRFRTDLLSVESEAALLGSIRGLPFREFEFHGYVGKRRTISFGWSYDFETETLRAAQPMPAFLQSLRLAAADFAEVNPDRIVQALVTEYPPGAEIGWHRDKAVFGVVIGVSLLSPCRFRLRRKHGNTWQRVTIDALPRSAYLLSGAARQEWEHSIPAVEETRFSVTFRTLQ